MTSAGARWYFSPREQIVLPRPGRSGYDLHICACRCRIKVHLKDGAIHYIEAIAITRLTRRCGKELPASCSAFDSFESRSEVGERGSSSCEN
jgi:hypothetical protein